MNRRGSTSLTVVMFLVVCISILAFYVLSVGPVFGYYLNNNVDDISKPLPRMIFKMYGPLIQLFPETSSRALEAHNVSTVEAYFMVHQEELEPPDAPSPSGTP